ncbi:MAG TPA: 2-phospho-L-lactate guanylyltransferase [Solirubrobacter sp.]|nr:2-phospho-L-lactate guanylyltransferase [Solirubrobacter sp.]
MRTVAILPVKSFGRAKQRLGDAVSNRPALAAAMVADVLDALARVPELDELIVVTAEPAAAEAATAAGARVVHDPVEAGQSAAAARGIAAASADRALLVPGDCPALDPDEVSALLKGSGPLRSVVIVPDRHGEGTNALLLTPPGVMEPAFGEGSFARHSARARAAGAAVEVAELPSLALDVDTPEDLAALLAGRAAAPRTRALLEDAAAA